MDFLATQEGDVFLSSPTSTRNSLTRVEVERQRSKADKVTWFTHNEFLWRSGASFLWFIFLLPAISVLYVTLVFFSLKHPIAWITDVFSKIFSFWELFVFILIFGIILTPIFLLNIRICSVKIKTGVTRLSFVKSFFTVKHLSHVTFCILSGSLAMHWLTSFTYHEYGILTRNCSTYSGRQLLCFNEVTVFLHVFGGFVGIVYSLLYFKEKHYELKFPVVQQERIFRVKACVIPSFWRAVIISFKSVQIGFPVYFFFGSFLKEFIRWCTGLRQDRQMPRLDSLYGILDLRLFWFCFTSGIVIAYIWLLANKLFIIFCTEVFRFPIQSTFSEDADQSLPVVLKCQTVPLLKYLAFNDLCQLSQFSSKRRQQIFSLSIPGGRPLNWLWVSEECLTLLNDLKERLTLHNNNNNHGYRVTRKTDSLVKPPTRGFRDVNLSLLKRTASSVRSQTTSEIPTPGSKTLRHTLTGHQSSGHKPSENNDNQRGHRVSISQKLKQIPLVEYLVEKVDELEMEDLFFDVQLQIWAAEGLSRLVAASFTEDVFGVVQKTLPFILTSLLELLQAVEIYLKRPVDQEVLYRKRHPSEVRKTVHVLRDSLRCSLYRITETFQQHIRDIELTSSNREFLVSFLKYQE